jgi:hypothetical protein
MRGWAAKTVSRIPKFCDSGKISASNYNWICFDCRFVTRQPKASPRVPKCAGCGCDCYCLGYKVEIPKKTEDRGWKTLRGESRKRHLASADRHALSRVREAHAAERRIARLRSLGPNKDREKTVEELQKKAHFS